MPPNPFAESFRARVARRYAFFVAGAVFLLLFAGAAVTSTGSGLAVPDWPLSYGQLMPPMVGGIFWEHGHRMIAAAVSTLVGAQVAVLVWARAPRRVRLLSYAAFGAILAQAALGGLTVLFLLPPAVSSAHAGLAEVVFALVATIAFHLARPAAAPAPGTAGDDGRARAARSLVVAATAAIFLQIVVGAVVRHTGAGLAIPDFPLSFGRLFPNLEALGRPGVSLHLAHRVGAVIVMLLVLGAAARLRALRDGAPRLARGGGFWLALVGIQILLGGASVWTRKAAIVTVAHLGVGALVWVTGVLLAVALGRRLDAIRPVARVAASAPASQAAGSPA